MTGESGATPDLDAEGLLASIPSLADHDGLQAQTVTNLPSAHLTLDDQLQICRRARDAARRGIGVVVTHGTDTLEETAMLCDVVHDAEAPIVFTGAIRPASAPAPTGRPTPSTRSASPPAKQPPGWGCWCASGARSTTRGAC
jgi:L-asparaginase